MFMQRVETADRAKISAAPLNDGDFDRLVEMSGAAHAFLRNSWFRAASPDCGFIGAFRQDGVPIAAIPYIERSIGPLALREVAGCYWPFRSFPISSDADDGELADFLAHGGTVRALGRLWRLGPVYADDPTAQRLIRAAPEAGWTVLKRSLGSVYELDLAALRQDGPWPSTKTKRKNRWRERRLAEDGEVRYEYFTGADWTRAQRDAMAEVEANCWLAGLEDGGDTKFQDSDARVVWEKACSDEALAPLLFGSLMWIGTTPVAFTFGVETGDTRYYVANNYDQRFSKFGPGKLLLYADFERAAAENGIARISWGAGDAGYKTEMGAQSGPEILDLLFVRGKALGALIRPLFLRGTKGSD